MLVPSIRFKLGAPRKASQAWLWHLGRTLYTLRCRSEIKTNQVFTRPNPTREVVGQPKGCLSDGLTGSFSKNDQALDTFHLG
jgi:hypothetical protein